jgi:hypothetical protein
MPESRNATTVSFFVETGCSPNEQDEAMMTASAHAAHRRPDLGFIVHLLICKYTG